MDPDTPSIINGGVMRLSGPCFNPNSEVIICRFYDTNKNIVQGNINGIITINDTGNEKAICPMPFFKTLGNHSIIITVDNNRKYSGSFTVGEYSAKLQCILLILPAYIYQHVCLCV